MRSCYLRTKNLCTRIKTRTALSWAIRDSVLSCFQEIFLNYSCGSRVVNHTLCVHPRVRSICLEGASHPSPRGLIGSTRLVVRVFVELWSGLAVRLRQKIGIFTKTNSVLAQVELWVLVARRKSKLVVVQAFNIKLSRIFKPYWAKPVNRAKPVESLKFKFESDF